jgi:hypothetical protein
VDIGGFRHLYEWMPCILASDIGVLVIGKRHDPGVAGVFTSATTLKSHLCGFNLIADYKNLARADVVESDLGRTATFKGGRSKQKRGRLTQGCAVARGVI